MKSGSNLRNPRQMSSQAKAVAALSGTKERFIYAAQASAGVTAKGFNTPIGGNAVLASVQNHLGQVKAGVSLTVASATGVGSTVRPGVGSYGFDIDNVLLQKAYSYATTGPFTLTFAGGAAYANKVGTCYVTSNFSGAGPVALYTIAGVSVQLASLAAGSTAVVKAVIPFKADASGNVVLTVANVTGGNPQLSGAIFEF